MAASTALSGFLWYDDDDYLNYYSYFSVNFSLSLAVLASLNAIAFALVFFALQWNSTKVMFMKSSFYIHELLQQLELQLIPALVMTPILSLTCLIIFIYIWLIAIAIHAYVCAHLTGLLYLLMAILSAYYWAGLKALYF